MHGKYCVRSEGDWLCGVGCTNEKEKELARLQKIEETARKLYKVLRGTMAAQSAAGLALKNALGEE